MDTKLFPMDFLPMELVSDVEQAGPRSIGD